MFLGSPVFFLVRFQRYARAYLIAQWALVFVWFASYAALHSIYGFVFSAAFCIIRSYRYPAGVEFFKGYMRIEKGVN